MAKLCNEKAEALVDTVPDTISELVAKTIADTLFILLVKLHITSAINLQQELR